MIDNWLGRSFQVGEKGKITVIGFDKVNPNILKVVCSICNGSHSEFYPRSFTVHKIGFEKQTYTCGCRKSRILQKGVKVKIIQEYCETNSYKLICCDDFNSVRILNPDSGNVWTTRLSDIKRGNKDPACKFKHQTKPDEFFIKRFYDVGSCKEGTIFCRSDKTTSQGSKNFWKVKCPVCYNKKGVIYEAISTTLMSGSLPCMCSNGTGFGYYPDKKECTDFLYCILFPSKDYFKVGRSFSPERRLKENKKRVCSYYEDDIETVLHATFCADHETIYKLEQILIGINCDSLYDEFRPKDSYGSTELIDNSKLNEVLKFSADYIEECWK